MSEIPSELAQILGLSVVYATYSGNFEYEMPFVTDFLYKLCHFGENQIMDGIRKILARLKSDDG